MSKKIILWRFIIFFVLKHESFYLNGCGSRAPLMCTWSLHGASCLPTLLATWCGNYLFTYFRTLFYNKNFDNNKIKINFVCKKSNVLFFGAAERVFFKAVFLTVFLVAFDLLTFFLGGVLVFFVVLLDFLGFTFLFDKGGLTILIVTFVLFTTILFYLLKYRLIL